MRCQRGVSAPGGLTNYITGVTLWEQDLISIQHPRTIIPLPGRGTSISPVLQQRRKRCTLGSGKVGEESTHGLKLAALSSAEGLLMFLSGDSYVSAISCALPPPQCLNVGVFKATPRCHGCCPDPEAVAVWLYCEGLIPPSLKGSVLLCLILREIIVGAL